MSVSSPLPATADNRTPTPVRFPALPLYVTALIEGACVIIIEIGGARALAPFFGTSLQVWTSQITVTLLFLAFGYGLGGLLSRHAAAERSGTPRSAAAGSARSPWKLSSLFTLAGAWLVLYPILRTPLLDFTAQHLNVAVGSLTAAATLFGLPLLMLGAVSPVLISYLDLRTPGAGSAAGRLFFTNTMGGLAGGWITAMILIPHCSLRVSLMTTGIVLITLGVLWAAFTQSRLAPILIVFLLSAVAIVALDRPPRSYVTKSGHHFDLLYSQQSGIGLLQVLDFDDHRQLRIDGVDQGDMIQDTGSYAWHDYIHDLALLSLSNHPEAKTALQLGLGAGMTPKFLVARGLKVTAVDVEPQIVQIARKYFALPDAVDVHISDARAFLRRDTNKYDLIFLDTFASESTAWHLLTRDAMADIKARLNPGGRLLVNTVAYADPKLPGLDGIESAVVSIFPQAILYPAPTITGKPDELINVTILAGENLQPRMVVPPGENAMTMLASLISRSRPATARIAPPTDDRNRLDYEQAPLRILWRTDIWSELPSALLWD